MIDDNPEELRKGHPVLRNVICHFGTETEEEIRNFAKKRGLHLTNWMLTKMHLTESPLTRFSQLGLRPLQH